MLQLCLFNDVPFTCGILLLISELAKRHPTGQRLLLFSQKATEVKLFSFLLRCRSHSSVKDKTVAADGDDDDDDEEEHFRDVLSDDEQTSQQVPQVSSWDHKALNQSRENHTYQYDLYKRNPLFCGADYTCVHELVFLKNHSHPTVALFAANLHQGKAIEYDGNPLVDFNSMRFFDRFIYKNPKKEIAKHGENDLN